MRNIASAIIVATGMVCATVLFLHGARDAAIAAVVAAVLAAGMVGEE